MTCILFNNRVRGCSIKMHKGSGLSKPEQKWSIKIYKRKIRGYSTPSWGINSIKPTHQSLKTTDSKASGLGEALQ
jgi:hypothetical protein